MATLSETIDWMATEGRPVPLTDDAINAHPIETYGSARPRLQSGDVMLASGKKGLLGRLIRRFTGSPYTHTGTIFRLDGWGRVLLAHSAEKGVAFEAFSKYVDHYNGKLIVVRHSSVALKPTLSNEMGAFATDHLGARYDVDELFKISARILKGSGRVSQDSEFICSEFVGEMFDYAGIPLAYDQRGFISPANIAANPDMTLITRLK